MALPLLDDSDHTVRQEAARAMAKLAQSREAKASVLERLPLHRRGTFEEELRKLEARHASPLRPREPEIVASKGVGGRKPARKSPEELSKSQSLAFGDGS